MIYNSSQLELLRVLEVLASFARTPRGKDYFFKEDRFLPPGELAERHALIREMEDVDASSFASLADLEGLVLLLEDDPLAVLQEKEAHQVLRTLPAFDLLRADLIRGEKKLLPAYGERMLDARPLCEPYAGRFLDTGELRPDATPALRSLRRREKQLFRDIQSLLQDQLKKMAPYLSDSTVSYRRERYCLPVKPAFQSKVQGVVLGASATHETLFIEPADVVLVNNDHHVVLEEIEAEKRRLLKEITDHLRAHLEPLKASLDIVAWLDFHKACRDYLESCKGILPEVVAPEEELRLLDGRHPLLDSMGGVVVPLSLRLSRPKRVVIISGPNGGGKTISLKTVGLIAVLARRGYPVPAGEGTKIPAFDRVLVSIGDAQDLQKGLSTFTSSISAMRHFLDEATPESLCLVDEIGFGTNPEEAAALSLALVETFLERGCVMMASTHLSQLKGLAFRDDRVANASMEFDEASHRPTFRFLPDIPGSSNALSIAEKFGLPASVLDKARSYLDPALREQETMLQTIQRLRLETEERLRSVKEREEELARILESIRDKKDELAKDFRNNFEVMKRSLWEEIHHRMEQLREEGIRIGKKKEQSVIATLTPELPAELQTPAAVPVLAVGVRVKLDSTRKEGRILRLKPEDGLAVVEVEGKNFWTGMDTLEPLEEPPAPSPGHVDLPASPEARLELNLIGKRVEEAEESIEQFLNQASLTGMKEVLIIHGHGTGRLKKGVRAFLKSHPLVKGFRRDERDGATYVEMKA